MRITLHAVHAEDHPRFKAAMLSSLRRSCLGDSRFTGMGLSIPEADELAAELTEFAAEPRTKVELEALIEKRLGEPKPGVWWALRRFVPMVHAPTGGPWSYGVKASWVAAGTEPADPEESTRWLARRYLEAFGPASPADLARFTLLTRPVARKAFESQDDLVVLEGPGGPLWDVPGAPIPDEDTPAPPRLMAMWDSTLLAYADHSRMIPSEHRALVTRNNGDVLPTLLVDGRVAGVWRPVEGGIEATAFRPLSEEDWDGLASEARALVAFLAGRESTVYSRYGHWWAKLPPADVRLLS
jgi:hypothetical protein